MILLKRISKSSHNDKDYDSGYDSESFKQEKSRYVIKNYANVIYTLILFNFLVWGSYILINSVSEFEKPNYDIEFLERYLKENSPPLLNNKGKDSFLLAQSYGSADLKIPLNISAVREGKFKPKIRQFQWIESPESKGNDQGTFMLKEQINGSDVYSIKSILDEKYNYVLYDKDSFDYDGYTYKIDDLIASPDLQNVILKTNTTKNWRHSSFSIFWVLQVKTKEIEPLFDSSSWISVAKWSPDSNFIAFVKDNNVFLKSLKESSVHQITSDGSSEVFNGRPDWVYEEEVFSSDVVLWWSPKGDKLAFLKTNDTEVPTITIPFYVQDSHDEYPEYRSIKYPKAGFPNPIVNLAVFDLNNLGTLGQNIEHDVEVIKYASDDMVESLITEVVWVSDADILVKRSNRASDVLEVYLYNNEDDASKMVRRYEAVDSWFEITSNTLFVPRNESLGRIDDGYIDTVIIEGYNHLAYFSPPSNPHGILLTRGNWEVCDGVSSFDAQNNIVYFVGTKKSSIERHIYSTSLLDALSKEGVDPNIQNITDISKGGWYSGSFSSASRYLLLTYEGPNVPHQSLIDLQSFLSVRNIEENKEVSKNCEEYDIPKLVYSVVSLGEEEGWRGKIYVNAIETFPLHFDSSKKYPVIFFVYGGPGSQLVEKRFSVSFSQVLAAQLNCVVVTIDGRGTGFNNLNEEGARFKFVVRDKLGDYEPRDQIKAAKIWSKRSYVDQARMAIWGWSYGGFLTLKTLETDHDHTFSFGVAVAPVTKWKLYDSIYTERYLRTPQVNPIGYETASIHDVSNFKNVRRFLIMHGSGDDNVHFQNSLKLLDEFNLESIENFDFMVYPDSDHSISYHNANIIVYDRILHWFQKNFESDI